MPELLTPDDIAKELGVSRQWITYLLREGKIKAMKVSRNWFITKENFEVYKAEQKPAKKK